ncbi:cytoskeleton protein RodZ [Serratia microhaemolytica]|uniref:cytoskeleton protein RodZ n=1 Tax=Serratia microhaemolytica TaxID=2675110 RepID=UPI000FDDBADD|nr:cytoskeleton protein RodZ [Serratia microhaemolytica]
MNTEENQNKIVSMTIGQRLRQAREEQGLTQQVVADRLYLKISTVRDIEEDNLATDLASTFVRGYVRAYIKLLNLPEGELLALLDQQQPAKVANVAKMQSFSLEKRRKKRDGWLMSFTWLVVFVVVGLTGAWWWQHHKAQQDEIATMAEQSSVELFKEKASSTGSSVSQEASNSLPIVLDQQSTVSTAPVSQPVPIHPVPLTGQTPAILAPEQPSSSVALNLSVSSVDTAPVSNPTAPLQTTGASQNGTADVNNALVMNFSADCWVQVIDASGKSLFSGTQKGGSQLNLSGVPPYKLTLGAPAAVEILFQGKPVDLTRFVRTNRVARLSVPAQ